MFAIALRSIGFIGKLLAWPKVTMLLITILATVVVSEWVSAQVRRRLI